MLDITSCRERQRRLLAAMQLASLDAAVIANPKNVYYFTGALVDPAQPQFFCLLASGDSLLITNTEPRRQHAATNVKLYTAYTLQRPFLHHTMAAEAVDALAGFLPARAHTGAEAEYVSIAAARLIGGFADITPAILDMRRRKDPDEIECIREVVRLTEAAYAAVKQRLAPGMTEYEAHVIMYEAAVRHTGTSVDLRGDFAAGVRAINGGGAPTDRRLERGDLYVLDIFPVYFGYRCDLCRTFVVGEPSALQREAWERVVEAHRLARRLIRPGIAARDLYEAVRAHLDGFAPARGSFTHHLGHGVGMDAWEFPWLIPGSDQVIREGDVIACEPALYSTELRGGIRLEHNYLVGADEAVPLDSFPLDL
jgi:Xaa-Pro aminopeptidase